MFAGGDQSSLYIKHADHSISVSSHSDPKATLNKLDGVLGSLPDASDNVDDEKIQDSHLTRYGKLCPTYLLDLSSQDGNQQAPLRAHAFTIDTNEKIGKIEGQGYLHYDTELLSTD